MASAGVIRELDGRDPNYEFVGQLGHGAFGSIAKVRRVSDGKMMACKAIDCSVGPFSIALANREISTWSTFSTSEKYIARFAYDVTWTKSTKTIRIYMKLYEGGDLQSVITACRHQDSVVHPFMATYWAMEIARGLKACHDNGIIHRDLKPANVLLDMPYTYNDLLWKIFRDIDQEQQHLVYEINQDDQELTDAEGTLIEEFSTWFENRSNSPWCHISDFGFGKFTSAAYLSAKHSNGSMGTIGTMGYLAPEIINQEPKFSMKSDVYSFGCLIYCLCTGKPPPPTAVEGEQRPEIPPPYPPTFRKIITRCLEFDPADRPNSRELSNVMADEFLEIAIEYNSTGGIMGMAEPSESLGPKPERFTPEIRESLNDCLRRAVAAENIEWMDVLIKVGADVNAGILDFKRVTPPIFDTKALVKVAHPFKSLDHAFNSLNLRRLYSRIYLKKATFPLLSAAAFNGSAEVVEFLLSRGAAKDENPNRIDPLSMAASQGFLGIVDTLVSKWGYNVNSQTINPLCIWWGKFTPIAVVAGYGNTEGVERLLYHGASPLVLGDSGTALHQVMSMSWSGTQVSQREDSMSDILRTRLDDVEACALLIFNAGPLAIYYNNALGQMPLHIAVAGAQYFGLRFVDFLITLGADPNVQNSAGEDAYHVKGIGGVEAVAEAYPEVKAALDRHIHKLEGIHSYTHPTIYSLGYNRPWVLDSVRN
ncbi:Serine/threonine-protein kinase Nek2 [Arthrobotrys musiformis]|uniref:Serine/threonine-protein kinase Nek2 n=1 Tax=Arthrobotrys musiformis TaxID=47236 RepID=A0AAV9WAJ7_9PEZI